MWNFLVFWAPFSLKTLLDHSSPTLAVQQTVEFACELFCIRRSRNQRDRSWPPIGHKHIFCAQSETSIWMSRGTGSLRKLRAWIISMGQVKSPARFFSWKGLHCSFNFFFSTKADRRFQQEAGGYTGLLQGVGHSNQRKSFTWGEK